MSNLLNSLRVVSALKFNNVHLRPFSSVLPWNKYWKPGPYPRTKEERLAAAKKYNMIPEDYEPYPEEEGYGDYPKFPPYHVDNRSDFEIYEYPVTKRHYGEPMHPDFDILQGDRVNTQYQFRTPLWKQFIYLTSGVSLYFLILILGDLFPFENKLAPKQYPYRGQKHYTFEPAE